MQWHTLPHPPAVHHIYGIPFPYASSPGWKLPGYDLQEIVSPIKNRTTFVLSSYMCRLPLPDKPVTSPRAEYCYHKWGKSQTSSICPLPSTGSTEPAYLPITGSVLVPHQRGTSGYNNTNLWVQKLCYGETSSIWSAEKYFEALPELLLPKSPEKACHKK